jgi:head-tail adaptor
VEQMRTEANTSRENLRSLIEKKLDQNIAQQSENAKTSREELSGSFERLRIRMRESISETSRIQFERLDNVTNALGMLIEKSANAQEKLRLTSKAALMQCAKTAS